MTWWFTSDHHFGHANIIKYTDRPFKDVQEMDTELIRRWNDLISDDDYVIHLGDFTLGENAVKYFEHLNGHISVLGNPWHHDRRWLPARHESLYTGSGERVHIRPPLDVVETNKVPIVLCHYPLAIWDRKHYGAWHLHGHSHGGYKGKGFIHDVGVDNNNFRPVSISEIRVIMEKKGWHPEWKEYA